MNDTPANRMLAIETTGSPLSAAYFEDGRPVCCIYSDIRRNHSVSLMPFLEQVMRIAGTDISDIGLIACSRGPGSFTGVRIGVAAAKGLAQALDKPVIPVPTLMSLAYNVYGAEGLIVPIMDARRGEVYACAYRRGGVPDGSEPADNGLPEAQTDVMALPIDILFDTIQKLAGGFSKKTIFLGDGANVYRERILERGYDIAPPHLILQNALSVGALAAKLYERGIWEDCARFQPFYIRKPQAERELMKRRGG